MLVSAGIRIHDSQILQRTATQLENSKSEFTTNRNTSSINFVGKEMHLTPVVLYVLVFLLLHSSSCRYSVIKDEKDIVALKPDKEGVKYLNPSL